MLLIGIYKHILIEKYLSWYIMGYTEDKVDSKEISDNMLSIACDGRYSTDDMLILKRNYKRNRRCLKLLHWIIQCAGIK